jgi:hypothetical protein
LHKLNYLQQIEKSPSGQIFSRAPTEAAKLFQPADSQQTENLPQGTFDLLILL